MYILVVATAAIAGAAALGAVAISQSSQRTSLAAAEWERATLAAESALEVALARLNQDSMWRRSVVSGSITDITSVGGAGVRLAFVDETDGDISANRDPVRIYAAATVGSSVRVLSVLASQRPPEALDLLRCSVHAAGTLTTSVSITSSGGPLSSNSRITNSGSILGSVEAPVVSNSGTIRGFITSGAPAKLMPAASIAQSLIDRARIVSTVLTTTTFTGVLWGSQSSPALLTSPNGIYYIVISPGQTVNISRLRIKATLVVRLPSAATLNISNEVLWDPADPSLPSLVVLAGDTAQINISGSTSRLAESSPLGNFNPAGTPYNGVSDSDVTDNYPSQLNGVFHIIGSGAVVTLSSNLTLDGCLISESPVTITGPCNLIAEPTLLSSPPEGYVNPANVSPVRASYRWETAAAFRSATGQDALSPTGGVLNLGPVSSVVTTATTTTTSATTDTTTGTASNATKTTTTTGNSSSLR